MTIARLHVGDARDIIAGIPDGSVNLVCTSPPFLALRKYGADDREMGSEANPAACIDALLELTAEFRRVLAPHGSIAIELGDTYSGSGGAGGDYNEDGLRAGQAKFAGSIKHERRPGRNAWEAAHPIAVPPPKTIPVSGRGWPLAKSLAGIPHAYALSLAYGYNVLDRHGPDSPAGRWRVRNVIVWARPNPPVGALGDKVRPATSYITVACVSDKRWFDLDAVRMPGSANTHRRNAKGVDSRPNNGKAADDDMRGGNFSTLAIADNPEAGAPPLDRWDPLADIIDAALRRAAAGEYSREDLFGGEEKVGRRKHQKETAGSKLLREATAAGIYQTGDVVDLPTKGYKGAHYATWPPQLAKRLIEMMCPLRVCRVCREPSRRIIDSERLLNGKPTEIPANRLRSGEATTGVRNMWGTRTTTLGWTDCGHNDWRPGHVLDPFAGSGTTLAVATGCGREATGIELYEKNAELIRDRLGMFLEVVEPAPFTIAVTGGQL